MWPVGGLEAEEVVSSTSSFNQNHARTSSVPRHCYMPAHLILLDLITRIIYDEE
jgi:hypothetical protein